METQQQNKPMLESEVPKAKSIDSPGGMENGHIWDELLCFPFSTPPNLHISYTLFREPGCVTLIEIPVREGV